MKKEEDKRHQDPGKESWLADGLLWAVCTFVMGVEGGTEGNRVSQGNAMQCACVCVRG